MYNHLKDSKNILISGCGGGYDIFCALDLYFNLIELGKNVVLGSYTFTRDEIITDTGQKIHECCYKINKDTIFDEQTYISEVIQDVEKLPSDFSKYVKCSKEEYIQSIINPNSTRKSCYFPEYKLIRQLVDKHNIQNASIYCFLENGIKQLTEAYNTIIEAENIDTIILMDGGTDSLMTGDEKDKDGKPALGTPYEDISSIVAVNNTQAKNKFLYCLGYNVDKYHGVTDESYLMNVSNLIKQDYFIGSYMLNKKDESTQKYIDVFMNCDPENSIVNSNIICSIQGHHGNYCP